jgi:hypothetical protein
MAKKNIKADYKKEIYLEDRDSSRKGEPHYKAVITGDDAGFRMKSVLYAVGEGWNPKLKDKPLVTYEIIDDVDAFTMHKFDGTPDVTISGQLGDLAEIRVLLEVIDRTYDRKGMFLSKVRIKKATVTRKIK